MKKLSILIVLFVVAVTAITSCKKQKQNIALATFTIGEPKVIKSDKSTALLKFGDVLDKDDTVKTDLNSQVTIQVGESIMFKVFPETTLKISKIFESLSTELYLDEGIVASKIKKLGKNHEYNVMTKTTLASVRGTMFLVTSGLKTTIVSTSRGEVAVKNIDTGEEKSIKQGQSAFVDIQIKIAPIQKLDSLYLDKINVTPFISKPESISDEELKKLEKELREKEKDIDEDIEILKLPAFNEGSLVQILTKDGNAYTGEVVSQTSEFVVLDTAMGKLRINKRDIRKNGINKLD